jgi:hypothetical protein
MTPHHRTVSDLRRKDLGLFQSYGNRLQKRIAYNK